MNPGNVSVSGGEPKFLPATVKPDTRHSTSLVRGT